MSDLALTYVELDIDYCSLTYGVSPCAALLGTTGLTKCYNTLATCQDTEHFTNVPVTIRFAMDTGHNPVGIEAIPNLLDVSITPGRISLGEDLGQRESVSLTFKDHPHSDTGDGFDKYLDDRGYDPYAQGSLWGKFRARQPYLKGRALRLYRGFVGDALADMECRHYIIDSFTGPGPDGRYTIVAKDILKLLDGDQAQAPALSKGSLAGSLASNGGSATLSPTGIGSTYPASGKIAIGGKEVMSFSRFGDTLTLSNRGSNGTTAIGHSAGDRVQLCIEYISADPAYIIADLMYADGGIDTSYLPTATWSTETTTFNRRLYTGIIAEPTPVRTLIQELIVQAGLAIWWDPVEQQVFLQVLRAVTADAKVFDESNILGGSFSLSEQPEKRVSQVWVYYGQRNPLEPQDQADNYRSSLVVLDTDAETNYGSAAIQKIYSRWIAFGGQLTAQRIGDLQLGRYVNPPRKFAFSRMRNAADGALILGAGYYIENAELQNSDGTRAMVPMQITRDRSDAAIHAYEAEENTYVSYDSDDSLTVIIDSSLRNVNLRTLFNSLYTSPLTGDVIRFVVNPSVLVGSNYSGPAIDVGSWPTQAITGNRTTGSKIITGITSTAGLTAGMFVHGTGIPARTKIQTVDSSTQITLDTNASSGSSTSTSITVDVVLLTLEIGGRVQGYGGFGGQGANGPAGTAGGGQQGGTALYSRYGINVIIDATGKLYSGGGGGGGAGTRVYGNHAGGGGGGGAGDGIGGGGGHGSTGPAQGGDNGSLDNGGSGGQSWTTNGGVFQQPSLQDPRGGSGGNPGQPGSSGGGSDSAGGVGGPAGYSIDGDSFVKLTNAGSIAGAQIN